MIRLEGFVLDGLDEFMLRLGHLKLLCSVSAEFGSGLNRIEREAATRLNTPIEIGDERADSVGRYLVAKKLCNVESDGSPADESRSVRYDDLTVVQGAAGLRLASRDGAKPTVKWQDYCLSADAVVSRVGAVTTKAKSASKTGLSHVVDWAVMSGLLTRSGEATPDALLLANLVGPSEPSPSNNPYLMGRERLILGYVLLSADFDVFSRLIPALAAAPRPITKRIGTEVYVETIRKLAEEAESGRSLSSHRAHILFQAAREVPGGSRRGSASTAWHRVASRLETYVDLGLLTKPASRQYEYVYELAPHIEMVVDSLRKAGSVDEWIAGYLTAIFGTRPSEGNVDVEEVLSIVPNLQRVLGRRQAPIPIVTVALAVLCQTEADTRSLGSVIRAVEALALSQSSKARLSRGDAGFGARFVSFL